MALIVGGRPDSVRWRIEDTFDRFGMKAEIKEEQLSQADWSRLEIEPDYEVRFLPVMTINEKLLEDSSILFATLTQERKSSGCQYYYDMADRSWERGEKPSGKKIEVCCYARGTLLHASDCLRTIDRLHQLSASLQKKLICLIHCESVLPYFSQASLAKKIAAEYSSSYGSLLLWQAEAQKRAGAAGGKDYNAFCSRWLQHVSRCHQAEEKIEGWLYGAARTVKTADVMDEELSGKTGLYSGPFYNEALADAKRPEAVRLIDVGLGQSLIYGEKEKLKEWRRAKPLMPCMPLLSGSYQLGEHMAFLRNESRYQGDNVYIGVITTAHGAYDDPALKNPDGTSRIVCIWDQEAQEQGSYYTGDQVLQIKEEHTGLASKKAGQQLTDCLKRMGGWQLGLAQKASFVIARINQAEETIRKAYGGQQESVLFGDVMIAAAKLSALAKANHKALVLLLIYQPVFDAWPAYQRWLESFNDVQGQLVVLPAGDNGMQQKCCQVKGEESSGKNIFFEVKEAAECVMGRLTVKNGRFEQVQLENSRAGSYELIDPQKVKLDAVTVETTGSMGRMEEMGEEIIWRLKPAIKGRWKLHLACSMGARGRLYGKLEEVPAGEKVGFYESTCQQTLNASVRGNLLCAGCWREQEKVLYGYSARGGQSSYPSWVVSDALTGGKEMASTLEAACLTAGLAACLCEKTARSGRKEEMCARYIRYEIIRALSHLEGISYPDQGQGYGILDLEAAIRLLEDEEGQN